MSAIGWARAIPGRIGRWLWQSRELMLRFVLALLSIFLVFRAFFQTHAGSALYTASLLCAFFAMVFSTGIRKEAWEEFFELLTEVSVALAFGFILVGFEKLGEAATTPAGRTAGPIAWSLTGEELVKISTIFILVFSAQLVARVARSLSKFESDKDTLKSTTDRLTDIAEQLAGQGTLLIQARLGGLAAKLLHLKEEELRPTGDYEVEGADALEASLGAMRAWIKVGRWLKEGKEVTSESIRAWWKMMEIYHREETFDVSHLEVATNVRNFAFMLLGAINSFLPRPNGKRLAKGSHGSSKLVVAIVTPFSPKDFYNFPNGSGRSRFYHEPEFFGTYRRVLSNLFRDRSRVVPLRIFLVDETPPEGDGTRPMGSGSSDPVTKEKGDIGWHLDSIEKTAIDCARLHFIPTPLLAPKRSDLLTLSSLSTGYKLPEGSTHPGILDDLPAMSEFRVAFPPANHPAARLPSSVKRFFWTPTYMHFGGVNRTQDGNGDQLVRSLSRALCSERNTEVDSYMDGLREISGIQTLKTAEDSWFRRQSRLQVVTERFEEVFLREFINGSGCDGKLAQYVDARWSSILESHFGSRFISERGEALKVWLQGKALDGAAEFVDQLNKLASGYETEHLNLQLLLLRDVMDAGHKLVGLHGPPQGADDAAEKKRLREIADVTLQLTELCHKLDAGMRYLGLGNVRENIVASTGVELGEAEDWLHRILIQCEATRLYADEGCTGPLPLWYLLGRELLGVPARQLPRVMDAPDHKFAARLEQALSRNASFCVVTPAMREYMQKLGVHAEFMLIGTTEEKIGENERPISANVSWRALIATGMNEPFHTCRVIARFGNLVGSSSLPADQDEPTTEPLLGGSALRAELKNHVRWLVEQWDGIKTQQEVNRKLVKVATPPVFKRFIELVASETNEMRAAKVMEVGPNHADSQQTILAGR